MLDRPVSTPHRIVNPATLAPATGFAHALVAAAGRTVYLGGQVASDVDGVVVGESLPQQFDLAAANVVRALEAAGAAPADVVSLHIYTTDVEGYRASLRDLGAAYRRHFGHHYPAMALFGVTALFDPAALIELVAVAVIPAARDRNEP